MFIVKNRKIFYGISILLIVCSILAVSIFGLTAGIDFKGGSSIEFVYSEVRPDVNTINSKIEGLNFKEPIGVYSVVPLGEKGYVLKLRTITDEERSSIVSAISVASSTNSVEFKKINSVGPTLGAEAEKKAVTSLVLVILFIVLYLTFAFRKVSDPVSSWKYGIISIIALCHDVIIPTGIFAILGHYFAGFEVDTLFVTAILVILGFSVHDTIVVFDRVRENLKNNRSDKGGRNFEEIIGMSIEQTFIRSINTSLTTLLAILVVYFVGPVATQNFALTLLFGIFFGTYSSIFIASNLLVTVEAWQKKSLAKHKK